MRCPVALILASTGLLALCGIAGTVAAEGALVAAAVPDTFVSPPSIDRITVNDFVFTYQAGSGVAMGGHAKAYWLSDGTYWNSGGYTSYYTGASVVDHVTVSGDSIGYVFTGPITLLTESDFGTSGHASAFSLRSKGPLVMFAYNGSTSAMLYGEAEVVSNNPLWTGYTGGAPATFNFLSSIVGATIPFIMSYQNYSETWTPTSFDHSFQYTYSGVYDFAHPITVPPLVGLAIRGSNCIPSASSVQFHAVAQYANGVEHDVTDRAIWDMAPSVLATQYLGRLTVGTLPAGTANFILGATYTERGVTQVQAKAVTANAALTVAPPNSWPMYQYDARHTGHVPISLDPAAFQPRWSRQLGEGQFLAPVTAADRRVYVSLSMYGSLSSNLLALDAATGATVWSRDFGRLYALNPPAYAYGNVYVQVSDGRDSTSVQAFDASTGELAFIAPHGAQWGNYLAPTIDGRLLAVEAGVYEGMFGFDPLSGDLLWIQVGLPQKQSWTPAVAGNYCYAYLGSGTGGLYAVQRETGALAYQIPDPGYSPGPAMSLAPVVGSAGELLVIWSNRLVAFDLLSHSIRWQVTRGFSGQPSVANGIIYAIDNGGLAAIDESTHADQWSWQPPSSTLTGPMIATDSHIFVCTSSRTYAIDLATHVSVWEAGVAGALAIAEGSLLVAAPNGVLTSFAVANLPTAVDPSATPATRLADVSPNPVHRDARVKFALAAGASVSLGIFDLMGRRVTSLVSGDLPAGTHERSWTPAPSMSPGIYVVRFEAGGIRMTRKIILVR